MSSTRTNVYASSPDVDASLENQLKLSLRRVQPNPEFIGHLHTRLTTPADTVVEHRQDTAFILLLMSFSLLSGILIIWLLRQLRTA